VDFAAIYHNRGEKPAGLGSVALQFWSLSDPYVFALRGVCMECPIKWITLPLSAKLGKSGILWLHPTNTVPVKHPETL
jgi:hypothetical protein